MPPRAEIKPLTTEQWDDLLDLSAAVAGLKVEVEEEERGNEVVGGEVDGKDGMADQSLAGLMDGEGEKWKVESHDEEEENVEEKDEAETGDEDKGDIKPSTTLSPALVLGNGEPDRPSGWYFYSEADLRLGNQLGVTAEQVYRMRSAKERDSASLAVDRIAVVFLRRRRGGRIE